MFLTECSDSNHDFLCHVQSLKPTLQCKQIRHFEYLAMNSVGFTKLHSLKIILKMERVTETLI